MRFAKCMQGRERRGRSFRINIDWAVLPNLVLVGNGEGEKRKKIQDQHLLGCATTSLICREGEGEKWKKFQDNHQLGCATKSRNCTEGTFKSPILALRHPGTRGGGGRPRTVEENCDGGAEENISQLQI